jgi:hypothetical protein
MLLSSTGKQSLTWLGSPDSVIIGNWSALANGV